MALAPPTPDAELKAQDDAAAAIAVAPRVTLNHLNTRVTGEYYFTAGAAIRALGTPLYVAKHPTDSLTICVLVLDNGWTVVGKSAPVSAANFNVSLGRDIARRDAIERLWPLEAYVLRERLHQEGK